MRFEDLLIAKRQVCLLLFGFLSSFRLPKDIMPSPRESGKTSLKERLSFEKHLKLKASPFILITS